MPEEPKDYTKAEFIETEDRLLIENFYLKLQNLQLQSAAVERQREDLVEEIQKTQTRMQNSLAGLAKKYGAPMGQRSIDKDGRILRPSPKVELPTPPDLIAAPKN